jgi:hypothetical protein
LWWYRTYWVQHCQRRLPLHCLALFRLCGDRRHRGHGGCARASGRSHVRGGRGACAVLPKGPCVG